jgi:hypothetical protein
MPVTLSLVVLIAPWPAHFVFAQTLSGNNTWAGQNTFVGQFTATNPCAIDGLIYVSTAGCYTNIQSAINALNNLPGTVIVPPGNFNITTPIVMENIVGSSPINNSQHIICAGIWATTITYTGSTAITAMLDIGTATNGTNQVVDVSVNGCTFVGTSNVMYGIRLRGTHYSDFSHNAVTNVAGAGIYTDFAVVDQFNDFHVSKNEGSGFNVQQPANCMYFDGASSNHMTTQASVISPVCEGVSGTGIVLNYCATCRISNGTSESNAGGMSIASTSNSNEVDDMDFEANTSFDLQTGGNTTTVHGGYSMGTLKVTGSATENVFHGGRYNNIAISSGAAATSFVNTTYNSGGSGTFTNGGTSTTKIGVTNISTGIPDQNLSAGIPFALTIASGTTAMGTGAIPAGNCASIVSNTVSDMQSTDTVIVNHANSGPPSNANGTLMLMGFYVSSTLMYLQECNPTASSITPTAENVVWRVLR